MEKDKKDPNREYNALTRIPEEDPRVLICFDCGTKEKVRETTCPFASEINNEEIEVDLCDACYRERMWDI